MKHEEKPKFTPYQIFIGILIKIPEIVKSVVKAIWRHITEALMVISVVSILIIAQAFDNGIINCITAMLLISIIGILLVVLVKVKILESRGDER